MENTQKRPHFKVNWQKVEEGTRKIVTELKHLKDTDFNGIIGFHRGGLPLATMLSYAFGKEHMVYSDIEFAIYVSQRTLVEGHYLLVDDIADSGNTFKAFLNNPILPKGITFTTASLFYRHSSNYIPNVVIFNAYDQWLDFPWELQPEF